MAMLDRLQFLDSPIALPLSARQLRLLLWEVPHCPTASSVSLAMVQGWLLRTKMRIGHLAFLLTDAGYFCSLRETSQFMNVQPRPAAKTCCCQHFTACWAQLLSHAELQEGLEAAAAVAMA